MTQDQFQAAVAKLQAAGFRGQLRRVIETVIYPGGNYEHDYIILSQNADGSGLKLEEKYTTDLFARYPEVTIQEATRIGLINPKNAAPAADSPDAPVAFVDINNFHMSGGVKYFASTAAGLSKPINFRATVNGETYLKTAYPRVTMFDPLEGWIKL